MSSPTVNIPMVNRHQIDEEVERKLDIIPLTLQYLFLQAQQILIKWNIEKDSQTYKDLIEDPLLKNEPIDFVGGRINIHSLEYMFDAGQKKLHHGKMLKVLNLDVECIYPLDTCWDLTAFLKKENGKVQDKVFLFDKRQTEVYNMNITTERYLELAYKAHCFYNWQLTYILKEKAPHFKVMKKYLPLILAHVEYDLQDFRIN
jgi:hypothetical protein